MALKLNIGSSSRLPPNFKIHLGPPFNTVAWLESYQVALKQASEKTGSADKGAGLVMAYFTGSDWCPYCQALHAEVFEQIKFKFWFNTHYMVPLVLDFPVNIPQSDEIKQQNAQLYTEYMIPGLPSVLAIKATELCLQSGRCIIIGSEIGRVVGYNPGTGASDWIDQFSGVAGIQ